MGMRQSRSESIQTCAFGSLLWVVVQMQRWQRGCLRGLARSGSGQPPPLLQRMGGCLARRWVAGQGSPALGRVSPALARPCRCCSLLLARWFRVGFGCGFLVDGIIIDKINSGAPCGVPRLRFGLLSGVALCNAAPIRGCLRGFLSAWG